MNKTTLKHNIRRILMLIAMMSLTLSANSQTCLLTLKDSTQYRGYIFKQSPGESIEFAITDDNTSKHIKWSDIYSIGKTLRGENAKFGYDDEITLRDERKMVGQIVKQVVGKSVTIRVRSGKTYNVATSKIARMRKIPMKGSKNMWNDRPYTNIVVLKNGIEYQGVVVELVNESDTKNSYLVLLTSGGYTEEIKYNNVEYYSTIPRKR